jgi:hypothetical protein
MDNNRQDYMTARKLLLDALHRGDITRAEFDEQIVERAIFFGLGGEKAFAQEPRTTPLDAIRAARANLH